MKTKTPCPKETINDFLNISCNKMGTETTLKAWVPRGYLAGARDIYLDSKDCAELAAAFAEIGQDLARHERNGGKDRS